MRQKPFVTSAVLIVVFIGLNGLVLAQSRVVRVSDEVGSIAPSELETSCACCNGERAIDPNCRAGCPRNVAWWSKPSTTPKYSGYYVGGDTAWWGCGRSAEDGTWGLDFVGGLFQRRVWLNWSHGRRYQGGIGAYKTDGPHLLNSLTEHE